MSTNDDLFSNLDAIEVPKPTPAPTAVPTMAERLRELGLIQESDVVAQPVPTDEATIESVADVGAAIDDAPDVSDEPDVVVVADDVPANLPTVEVPGDASLEPEHVVVAMPAAQSIVEPQPAAQGSKRWIWVSAALVAVVAVAGGGWWFASIYKESPPQAVVPPAPVVQPQPVAVASPAPAPAQVEQPAVPAPVQEPVPMAAPAPEPKPVSSAASPKPRPAKTKPVAQPKPETDPQWQDHAMDQLDDLEKRL